MADIRGDDWEWLHYDNPDFQVQYRINRITAHEKFPELKVHWHDDVEFIYVISGSCGYYINNKYVVIHQGEGLFVNARQRHLIETTDEDCKLYCLMFHPVIMCSSEYITRNYVMPVIESEKLSYMILSENNPRDMRMLQRIADMEQYIFSETGHMHVMRLIYDIWDGIFSSIVCDSSEKVNSNKDLVSMKRMVTFIHQNYTHTIKLSDICRAGNVGKTKCNQLFSMHYNLTPMEYLRNYRIDKGAKMLEITDMSITEIAYEIGFTDGSYFAKVFHQQIGCSPQNYRSYGKGLSRYYEQSRYTSVLPGI